MEKPSSEELSGLLHVRTTTNGKKGSKKQKWCILNKRTNQLECYKHEKDVSTQKPIDQLQLYGASVLFGNNSEHEFIVNIRGVEYCMNAENHKTLMKWVNILQKQVKSKPAVTGSAGNAEAILESVPEDEPLQIKRTTKEKKKSIFHRIFGRKSKSRRDLSSSHNHAMDEQQRTVKPAPLRSVVGSMQDITDKKVSCNECNLLQGRNIYLNEQVQKLNEDVENIKDQLRSYVRKSSTLELQNIFTKKELVNTVLNALVDEDDSYKVLEDVPFNRSIVDLLRKECELEEGNRLPVLTDDGKIEPHEDQFGFIHGRKESPLNMLFYLCQELKRNYTTLLHISDHTYQQWQTVVSSIKSQSLSKPDETLKGLVQKGIPHEFRGSVWKMLVDCQVESIQNEKGAAYYDSLVAKLPDLTEDEEADGSIEKQIKIDLLRTFPTHKEFREFDEGKIPVLHRILRAYLLHNPEISYCQGMNFMVAFAMLYLEEETCFWLLVAVTEVIFCKNHYNLYLSGTQANQKVLEALCHQTMPDMMKHLDELTCELSPVTFNWFMTVFIDSLPVDMVLQVWDVFLVFGHPILYKVALCLLKVHKKMVMKSKDALTAMRKLKKLGKTYYDNEQFMKDVFSSEILSDEKLVELYNKYMDEIEEDNSKRKVEDEEYEKRRQKLKFTPKQMMVSISDNLDALEDDLVIKYAECESNQNNVWLCCTSDLMAQIFILNVASRNIDPINWQVPCKCLAMSRFARSNLMLVSTIKSTLHAIDVEKKTEVWDLQLAGAALSINCDPSGNVILTLMDGTLAFLSIKTKEHQTQPTYVDISRSPVMCGLIVDDMFWCGAANMILVLDIKTLETTRSMRICPVERHSVSHLVESERGVWSCVEGSSVIHMWHKTKYIPLLTVDILVEGGLVSEKKTGTLLSTGITTAIVLKEKLWVGFGNGRFIISDIIRETGNTDDDLNDAFNFYKSMEDIDKVETTPTPTTNAANNKQNDSAPKLGVATCCHALVGEDLNRTSKDSPRLKQYVDDATDFVMVDKRVSAVMETNEEYRLMLNQIQRVSENRVNCFVPCRNDKKLILTCMGALNDDSSVILWSSEKREGREMWFAQTVSYSE